MVQLIIYYLLSYKVKKILRQYSHVRIMYNILYLKSYDLIFKKDKKKFII